MQDHDALRAMRTNEMPASVRLLLVATGLWAGATFTSPIMAQGVTPHVTLPSVSDTGQMRKADGTPFSLPNTAAHAQYAVRKYEDECKARYSMLDSLPKDSVRAVVVRFAANRADKCGPASGLQLQPLGVVSIRADRDSEGERRFDQWLTTPKLPVEDKASTYLTQIETNLDDERPARIAVAEEALRNLEQLGVRYRKYAVDGHRKHIVTYYKLGMRDSMIAHGERGLRMALEAKTWEQRYEMLRFWPVLELAQAYSGLPDGKARIDKMITQWRTSFDLAPTDPRNENQSWSVPRGQEWADGFVKQARKIGNPAFTLQAHVWLNTPDESRKATPVQKSLADGRVRLIEFGTISCPGCLKMMPVIKRIAKQFESDGVEVLLVTETEGSWNIDVVPTDTEVARLRHMYIERMHLTYPIAIWAPEKVANERGGESPLPSPNVENYNVQLTPTLAIVDGAGKIRWISGGVLDEAILRQILTFLVRETKAGTTLPLPPKRAERPSGVPPAVVIPAATASTRTP